MTHTDFANRTLADIASTVPGATALFRAEKLDFCCGGKALLVDAMAARQKDSGELVAKLEALAAEPRPSDAPQDVDTMIDMILARFHETHRREIPELIKLARRVEAVHRDNASVPAGLADLLEHIGSELESHMQKEEQVLFPMMRRGGHPMISAPISVMLAEHDEHGENLRRLEALTNDFTAPADACTTWRALYAGARKLTDDVMEHIHTENNKLFPRFGI
ncbi:MAG: iron-sulfur cluster repair protein YtfE [Hyphomicrobiales bacterium]|nr:iron-sulfur cluster repair protein YtfE [Hyphomicrobiales bacterium]